MEKGWNPRKPLETRLTELPNTSISASRIASGLPPLPPLPPGFSPFPGFSPSSPARSDPRPKRDPDEPKPIVYVEARLKNTSGSFVRTDMIREEVTEWLKKSYPDSLRIGQEIDDQTFQKLPHYSIIESISIFDCSLTEETNDIRGFNMADIKLDVQAYYCQEGDHDNPPKQRSAGPDAGDDDSGPQLRVSPLPSKTLNGAWDSLIFDDPIPSRLLKFMTRMMTLFRNPDINSSVINWNRLILLHGPPGTGKSTLAKALAQKLTIRMGKHFTLGKLVEINAQAVLSKWFGESSKLVGKMFDAVLALAEDETTLVCLVIDEVETLASSREKASQGNECGDAVRATNQVLTALDQLRNRQNVIVICTSNLINTIDAAFLDRVDIKEYIPYPRTESIFDIFRSSINELIRCGLLVPSPDPQDVVVWHPRIPMKVHFEYAWESDACWREEFAEAKVILPLHVTVTSLNHRPNSPSRRVLRAAKRCEGMSGRTLRRLPFLALAMYTDREPCKVHEGLAALSKAIDVELRRHGPAEEDMKYDDKEESEQDDLTEEGGRPYSPTVRHPYYESMETP